MPDPHITIQRLAIRTRNLSEATVRAALIDLGPALQQAFADHPTLRRDSLHLDTLKLAPIQTTADPAQLRQALATHIATALTTAFSTTYRALPSPPTSRGGQAQGQPLRPHPPTRR